MKEPTRSPLVTEERGEPAIIAVRKGDRLQLLIVDQRDEPARTLCFDISPERALRLARDFLNEVVR